MGEQVGEIYTLWEKAVVELTEEARTQYGETVSLFWQ